MTEKWGYVPPSVFFPFFFRGESSRHDHQFYIWSSLRYLVMEREGEDKLEINNVSDTDHSVKPFGDMTSQTVMVHMKPSPSHYNVRCVNHCFSHSDWNNKNWYVITCYLSNTHTHTCAWYGDGEMQVICINYVRGKRTGEICMTRLLGWTSGPRKRPVMRVTSYHSGGQWGFYVTTTAFMTLFVTSWMGGVISEKEPSLSAYCWSTYTNN